MASYLKQSRYIIQLIAITLLIFIKFTSPTSKNVSRPEIILLVSPNSESGSKDEFQTLPLNDSVNLFPNETQSIITNQQKKQNYTVLTTPQLHGQHSASVNESFDDFNPSLTSLSRIIAGARSHFAAQSRRHAHQSTLTSNRTDSTALMMGLVYSSPPYGFGFRRVIPSSRIGTSFDSDSFSSNPVNIFPEWNPEHDSQSDLEYLNNHENATHILLDSDDVCPICLEHFQNGSFVRRVCGQEHFVCVDCIAHMDASVVRRRCVLCRGYKQDEIKHPYRVVTQLKEEIVTNCGNEENQICFKQFVDEELVKCLCGKEYSICAKWRKLWGLSSRACTTCTDLKQKNNSKHHDVM